MRLRRIIAIAGIGLLAACSSSPEKSDTRDQTLEKTTEQTARQKQGHGASTDSAEPTPEERQAAKMAADIGPVATVNEQEVPAIEFAREFQALLATGKPATFVAKAGRPMIMQKLTERYIVDSEIDEKNVEVTEGEVQAKLDSFLTIYARGKDLDREQVTAASVASQLGQSEAEFLEAIRRSLATQKLLEARGVEGPSQKEVRAFYDKHRESRYAQPDRVHLLHMVATVERGADDAARAAAKKKAEEFYRKATREGADYRALVKQHSDGAMAEREGDLGFMSRNRLPKKVAEVAFSTDDGEISKPFESDAGWHVIKVVASKDARKLGFEEVRDEIVAELAARSLARERKALVAELRKTAEIQVNEENVDAVVQRFVEGAGK